MCPSLRLGRAAFFARATTAPALAACDAMICASARLGAFPPVAFLAVCFIRGIAGRVSASMGCRTGRPTFL
eukprot:1969488-Rhodomonas_salina.1